MPHKLEAREFKLLLDPTAVGATLPELARFAATTIRSVVHGPADTAGTWERRDVVYYDTADHALDRAGVSLRWRRRRHAKLTAKLRLSDRFVVAAAHFRASHDGEDKFEEDVSPLEGTTADGRLAVADPPDIRSRFSLSVEEDAPHRLDTMHDAYATFPHLADVLRDLGAPLDPHEALHPGPAIVENVLDGPGMKFGETASRVTITDWALAPGALVPRVVEASFRVALGDDEHLPRSAAQEALATFSAMQLGLPVNLDFPSKTKLALPRLPAPAAANRTVSRAG